MSLIAKTFATHRGHGYSRKANGAGEGDSDSLLNGIDILELLWCGRGHRLLIVADVEAERSISGLDQRGLEVVCWGRGVGTQGKVWRLYS